MQVQAYHAEYMQANRAVYLQAYLASQQKYPMPSLTRPLPKELIESEQMTNSAQGSELLRRVQVALTLNEQGHIQRRG